MPAGDVVAHPNFQEGRTSDNVYFCALVETAVWGAELATALAGSGERGHIYVVEPTGPFEDDPNLTNKKFPATRAGRHRGRAVTIEPPHPAQ